MSLRVRLRKKATTVAIKSTIVGLSHAGKLHPYSREMSRGVERFRNIPYIDDGDPAHTLDIYRPAGRDKDLPVLLYLHGGGFIILSKDTHWMFGDGFAKRGWLAVTINYRLAPRHPFPAALDDASHALEWVMNHASEYGGDLSTLVYAGESAGGNLATSLALASSYRRDEPFARRIWDLDPRPKAALPACGILDVHDPERFLRRNDVPPWVYQRIRNVCRSYLPKSDRDAEETALASPLRFLEAAGAPDRPLPSFFAPCGTADWIADDTRRLDRALDRLGLRYSAPFYDGGIHAFHAFVWHHLSKKCWADQDAFLRDHVFDPVEPSPSKLG